MAERIAEALRLVVVSDGSGALARLEELAEAAFRGGASAFWIRERSAPRRLLVDAARAVVRAAGRHGGAVLVAGDVELALELGLFGVHLGFQDESPAVARGRLSGRIRVGFSAHAPIDHQRLRGADYVTLSPVFATPKANRDAPAPLGLARFAELCARVALPVIGLGGITAENAASVIRAGAAGVAVRRAVTGAADPAAAARRLRAVLDEALG